MTGAYKDACVAQHAGTHSERTRVAPVLVPGDHDEAVGVLAQQRAGEELALAAAPDNLDAVGEAAVLALAYVGHLLRMRGATRDGASDVCTLEPSPRYGHAGSALLYTCAARNRVCACAQQTGEGRQKHDSL